MDINHVCFMATKKFDGRTHRRLAPSEIGQIAGRAGRHMRNGSFGTSNEIGSFDNDLVKCLKIIRAKLLIVSFDSDWLFPKEYGVEIQMSAIKAGINSSYIELEGDYGHDSFLFHSDRYSAALKNFLNSNE